MRAEIEMVKAQHERHGIPVRAVLEDARPPVDELLKRRKLMRQEVDDLLRVMLNHDSLTELAMRIARVAFATAGTCVQFAAEPDYPHFAEAIKAQFEAAQRKLDEALRVWDAHDVRVAASELENAIFALSAQVGLPYAAVVRYAHERFLAGEPLEPERVKEILRAAGRDPSDPEKPNEPEGGAA